VSTASSRKACSMCGKSFALAEFAYGNRENRSYCRQCDRAEKQAYSKGGVEGARAYREAMRAKWQR
jgi:ribosomal protein S27AE